MVEKLNKLKELIEKETLERFVSDNKKDGYPFDTENIFRLHGKSSIFVNIRPGKKYTKVDVGASGKYMVVNDTGEIFGIKAYGVIHRGHRYGTLDTINDWYWGRYTAIKR
jgi:hypothetical protein